MLMRIDEIYKPEHMTVGDMLYIAAEKYPDKEAVIFQNRHITYREINEESNKIANYILGLGIEKGTKISMMMTNSEKFVSVYFGILKAGCIVIPINIKFTYREVDYIVRNSEASIIFMSEEFTDIGEQLFIHNPHVKVIVTEHVMEQVAVLSDLLPELPVNRPDTVVTEEDLCSIIYTSGTTGVPRGAVFNHRKIVFNASIIGALNHGYNYESRSLIIMPMTHSAPMNNHVLGTIYAGGTLVIHKKFEPHAFLSAIGKEKITHFFGPAMVYLSCAKNCDMSQYDLSSVKMFIVGGSPIGESSLLEVIEKFRLEGRLMQVYGLTEGGPSGCSILPQDMVRKAASIGIGGCIGAEIKLVDEKLDIITEPGVVGQIAVYCESNMLEYYKDEQRTKDTLVNGWVLTGDLGRYDEEGYIYFVDRLKDIIISGGQNVYSKEVENAIMENPDVQEAAVIGVEHPIWGETVKAVVVPVKGTTLRPDDVKNFCKTRIADFKRPRYVQVVSQLPHNASGKVVKPVVRNLYGAPADSPRFVINRQKCTMCGLCADVCPVGAISQFKYEINEEKCTACGACASSCPSGAI